MRAVPIEGAPLLEQCGCGVHVKGRCDSDFPRTTHGLPYTDNQVRAMAEGRAHFGLGMPDIALARRAAAMGLSVTFQGHSVTGQECEQCGEFFTPERSTAKYCSTKCRVAASRE